jgi:hypothetical protein
MYTGPGRFTRAWQKAREFPPPVQGAAVVAVVVLAAVGATHAQHGSSGPDQIVSPTASAPAALDSTPSAEPSHSSFASSDDTPLLDDDATASPSASTGPTDTASATPTDTASASPSPTDTATASPTSFMYPDCKAIKAAGRDPLSKGEYGYNPELDKDFDGVDCH